MCRMAFVSTKENNKAFEIAKAAQIQWASEGHTDGTGLGYWQKKDGKFNFFKQAISAPLFYSLYFNDGIFCKNIMAHNRIKSKGGSDSPNCHPFMFESKTRKDKNGNPIHIMSCHNGTAYNDDKARQALIKAGHDIYSTVDSEIIAGAFAEWDIDFIKKMDDLGVNGWLNVLVVTDEDEPKLYAYSDGSLSIHIDDEKLIVASSFTWDKDLKNTDIPSGDLIEINLVTWERKLVYSHKIHYQKSTPTIYGGCSTLNYHTTKMEALNEWWYDWNSGDWTKKQPKSNITKIMEQKFEDYGYNTCPICKKDTLVWNGSYVTCKDCKYEMGTITQFCKNDERQVNAKDCFFCEKILCNNCINIETEMKFFKNSCYLTRKYKNVDKTKA